MDVLLLNFELELENFSLKDSINCGQFFRFEEVAKDKFLIFTRNKSCYIEQCGKKLIVTQSNCGVDFWKSFLNFDKDYKSLLNGFRGDILLEKLIKLCGGIRILKQDPFETLLSFIISANNNISRIKSIIKTFCENFGEKNENGYSFPTVDRLVCFKEEDFKVLRAGFRLKYIVDAIRKVYLGEVDLNGLYHKNALEAVSELKKIYGVGDKVANCVVLFAYNNMMAFPVDVWIKKVVNEYYKNGVSSQVCSCPGLAQQFLFYGKREGYI